MKAITKEQALEALDSLDDFARMADIEAVGPLKVLKNYIEQRELDAKRFQWLKANHLQTGKDSWIRTGEDLEEAIDAALTAEAAEEVLKGRT